MSVFGNFCTGLFSSLTVAGMVSVFGVVVLVVVIAQKQQRWDFSCMWPGVRKLLMGQEFGAKNK